MIKELNQLVESSESLVGKRALISGGTTGIGRAIALAIARAGGAVMIFGRNEEHLNDALGELGDQGQGLVADQSKGDDIEKVFAKVDESWGGLDILVNNAAIGAESVATTPFDQIQYALMTNLFGYLACCHAAIVRMKTAGQGDIVHIGSMSAVQLGKDTDLYSATKTGVAGFNDSLRKRVREDNIRVTLIEPGLVGTDMTLPEHPLEKQREMEEKGEMLKAEDIAECVMFALTRPRRCDVIHIRAQPHMEKE